MSRSRPTADVRARGCVLRVLRSGLAAAVIAAAAAPSAAQDASLGQPFATKHGVFEPIAFVDVPGWGDDVLHESAEGMRATCSALRRKAGWAAACAAFDGVGTGDDHALRTFFETYFHAYRILSPARQPDGLITGYFEPLLEGRRQRDDQFRFPVYGMPNDLLLLDGAVRAAGSRQWLKRDGHRLKPAAAGGAGAREYTLALDDAPAGVRDKRLRVRIEGDRVLPYWSRQDIELRALDAPVLGWVAAPDKLYSMQIQGSGKLRLEDGSLIRVNYAEQNGHPFQPNRTRGTDQTMALGMIKSRGLSAGGSGGVVRADPRVPAAVNDEVARLVALFQGGSGGSGAAAMPAPRPAPQASPSRPARPSAATDPAEVAALIAALQGKGPMPASRPAPGASSRPAASTSPTSSSGATPKPVASVGAPATTRIPDPSYVFFRSNGDGPQGPVGALGVPLTAGRSLAVDPRSTPLGSPVFISTRQPAGDGPLRRLMFAQDTGGAIRGSVRGDLFWGFGDSAGRMALATNEVAQMWLLLPRAQVVTAAAEAGPTLRSLRRRDPSALPDCVVADPDLCVED